MAALLAWVILEEPVSLLQMSGGLLILVGTVVARPQPQAVRPGN